MLKLVRSTGAAIVLCGVLPGATAADSIEDFYRGKTITIVVGSGAGGAYGLSARLFGDYATKHIPGNPNVIYQYMPGSGGVKVMNYIYNAAAKGGTVIGMPQQGTPLGKVLQDDPNMKFDNTKLNWIGTVARSHYLIGVWHTAPATTVEGARQKEVLLGSSGQSSTTTIYPLLINYIAGTKLKPLHGYKGAADMDLAYERGETHGRGGTWMAWKTRQMHHIRDGNLKFLVQITGERLPEFPDVPTLLELAKTDEDKAIVRFMQVPGSIGRSLMMPPGVPAERVEAMRRAFDTTMKDPKMLGDATKRGFVVTGESGEELQAVMAELASTPPAIIAKARQAIGMK